MSSVRKTRYLTFVAATLSLAIGGWAVAQRSDSKSDEKSESKGWGGQLSQGLMDQMAAEGIMQMSKSQIELANFALKHTQNENVRRFAQTSIENCTNLNNQLEKFTHEEGGEHADRDRRASDKDEKNEKSAAKSDEQKDSDSSSKHEKETADQGNASNWKSRNIDVVRRDISNQVVASIEHELAQYQGPDFDKAFVGQQFWGHLTFVAASKAGDKHVSNELRKIVDEGAQQSEKQLEECRKLIRDLASNIARTPDTNTPRR